ncbi:hypothetical protein VPHD148_0010 [Vibrio phage D148]
MEGRRYPEGGTAPVLQFPDRQNSYTEQEALRKKRRTKWIVPVPDSSLSPTSDAKACFVYRENSKIFQQFALNYAYNIVTTMVLSGEV